MWPFNKKKHYILTITTVYQNPEICNNTYAWYSTNYKKLIKVATDNIQLLKKYELTYYDSIAKDANYVMQCNNHLKSQMSDWIKNGDKYYGLPYADWHMIQKDEHRWIIETKVQLQEVEEV